ncbi:hypothetical protein CIRG_02045 [Coccidioides immitis RMSCC 2394]|uniref:Uncharacterized protein n=1 Tax=Coccidioides immitis RMSCC 2394 TaxID=404692 RepID=A0A0J6XZY1_COCIT|nr:hypothetical protein CIRG_02045 [Coccidioides immitis RMSCC 2394]
MSAATTISGQPRLFDALMRPAHISGIHSSDDGVFLSILLQEAQSSYLISPLIHNPQGLLPFIGGAGSHNHQIMYHTNKGWVRLEKSCFGEQGRLSTREMSTIALSGS